MRKLLFTLALIAILPGLIFAKPITKVGSLQQLTGTNSTGTIVTALVQNSYTYFPSTDGISIKDFEYFAYSIMLDDASDDAVNTTWSIEICVDGTNWDVYTQTVLFPIDAAAAGTIDIDDENLHVGSIHPMPAAKMRLKVKDDANQADVAFTVYLLRQ